MGQRENAVVQVFRKDCRCTTDPRRMATQNIEGTATSSLLPQKFSLWMEGMPAGDDSYLLHQIIVAHSTVPRPRRTTPVEQR